MTCKHLSNLDITVVFKYFSKTDSLYSLGKSMEVSGCQAIAKYHPAKVSLDQRFFVVLSSLEVPHTTIF